MRGFYKAFVFSLILAAPTMALAQCGNQVVVQGSTAQGSLRFSVEAAGTFAGKLVAYKNADKIVVKEFSGSHHTEFTYTDLDASYAYRIDVDFDGADNFLCSNKVVDGIILGNTTSKDR